MSSQCTISDCKNKTIAKGLCRKHYYRKFRTGSTDCGKVFHGHGSEQSGRSPTYNTWRSMRARCKYKSVDRFSEYGGRGIKVCERWQNSFANFLEDMGARPENHTIDRIDVNGDYEPSNCRWAKAEVQSNNKRCSRLIEIYGKRMSVKQWHKIVSHQVESRTIYSRLDAGWTAKEAVFGRAV